MKKITKKLNFYFENTTLHGFAYITGRTHWFERMFWICAIISSFISCLLLFGQLADKIKNNPIVVVSPDVPQSIKDIPFPALSLCADSILNDNYGLFVSILKFNNATYPKNLRTCRDWWNCFAPNIHWKNLELYAQFMLKFEAIWVKKLQLIANMTISQFGWCSTFNVVDEPDMLHTNSIAEYFQYQNSSNFTKPSELQQYNQSYPLFTVTKDRGILVTIHRIRDPLMLCIGRENNCTNQRGFTLVIHSPHELPDSRHRSINVQEQDFAKLLIEPQIRITDETMLDMAIDDRRCYKPDEHQLHYFKTYTSINCLKECESSFILQKCGCVPYYFINNDTSLICSTTQLKCFKREFEEFEEVKCRCYPPCDEIGYEFVVIKSSGMGLFHDLSMKIIANFKDSSFYPKIRRKYFTMIDWFSFVGGILGLFFGFSFLSTFEVVFHVWLGIFGQKKKALKLKKAFEYQVSGCTKSWKYLKSFTESSSIHGIKSISDDNLRGYEKFSWVVSFIVSISACSLMIHQLQGKFQIDSTSIVYSLSYFNVTQIPFPAVTLMNSQPIDCLLLKEEKNKNINPIDCIHFQSFFRTIVANPGKIGYEMSRLGQGIEQFFGNNTVATLRAFWNQINSEIVEITWNGNYNVPTATLLTGFGIGQSFNIIPSHEFFDESRISSDFTYIHTNSFTGGLYNKSTAIPWSSEYFYDDSLFLKSESYAFELPYIFMHSPFEYPILFPTEDFRVLTMRICTKILVLVTAEMTTVSDDFAALPLSHRKCFMDGEKKLNFFKIYTQRNCEIECLSNKLQQSCGCVPFDVIRDNKTRVCRPSEYDCVEQIKNNDLNSGNLLIQCQCFQPCSHLSYKFELIEEKHPRGLDIREVLIKFKDNEFLSMQRVRQFTIFDFLSYIGGLLGLFAGISVLSIFEIFYFFTLRLICEFMKLQRGQLRDGCENTVTIVAPLTVD